MVTHSPLFYILCRGLRYTKTTQAVRNPFNHPNSIAGMPDWWDSVLKKEFATDGTKVSIRRWTDRDVDWTELVLDNHYAHHFELLPRKVAPAAETIRKINERYQHFC